MATRDRPNFIVILSDDQGYGDLGCMGAKDLETPHLDALAAGGARFTNWYANAPVCAPSRAALLTGRYPAHAGVRGNPGQDPGAGGLAPGTPTFATAFQKLGYRTGLFGKWHQGSGEGQRPHEQGFDEWFGFLNGCIDYYSHIFYWGMSDGKHDPVHDLWENGTEIFENGRYFTELVTERATAFLRRAAESRQPFFMYLPYNAPHYPMHAPNAYLDRFKDLPWARRVMAALLAAMDDSIGAIVAELKQLGVSENTCVFFQSDNGPSRETRNWGDGTQDPYRGGTTGGLRGHKFNLYEGGIRVPALLNWPQRVPAGNVIQGMGAAMDVFPTLIKAAGGDPAGYDLDGLDVFPMAVDGAPSPHRELFWESGRQTAVRRGPWKLILDGESVEGPDEPVRLSNLDEDPREQRNLAPEHPDIAEELKTAAQHWRTTFEKPRAR